MKRLATTTFKTIIDLGALAIVFVLAWNLRFDWEVPANQWPRILAALPYVVALQYAGLAAFVVPQFAWSYVGLREVTRIAYAMALSTGVLLALRLIAPPLMRTFPPIQHVSISAGVILIDFMLGFCAITGLRVFRRLANERATRVVRHPTAKPQTQLRTVLVGAGQAGVMVAKEIERRGDLGMVPVGFVDDDPAKQGIIVHGLRVLGTTESLQSVIARTNAEQVLITIAGAAGPAIRRVVKLTETLGIPAKIVPGIHEIVGGQVNLSRLRDVAIEDLLRRDPVVLDEGEISAAVRDKVVLVTGAGGSIGSELCRQLCRFEPKLLLLVERTENNLFEIHRELLDLFPSTELVPLIADVGDEQRMQTIFAAHKPHFVLHAAAYKHVPLMESNITEAVKNNVFGTKTLADLAHRHGVSRFVMISTDKAVNPSSIMGACKRISEIYTQALSRRSKTKYINVRFGNVLGSAGSVVPIFTKQIAKGGPVTITHPEMRRYFMTIPEASQLVLQAAAMGDGGEIFILDMGEPVRIVDLAEDLIKLSGLRPGEDIEIKFTGVRPGEKLFEELSFEQEKADKTRHDKIFVGRLEAYSWERIEGHLGRLGPLVQTDDEAGLRHQIGLAVPELAVPVGQGSAHGRAVPREPAPAMDAIALETAGQPSS